MPELLRRVRSESLARIPSRIVNLAARRLRYSLQRRRDRSRYGVLSDARRVNSSGGGRGPELWDPEFARHLVGDDTRSAILRQADNADESAGFNQVAIRALDHRFDLLGSGLVYLTYESVAAPGSDTRYGMSPGPEAESEQRQKMTELLLRGVQGSAVRSADSKLLVSAISTYKPIDWHVDFKSGYRWDPLSWHMDVPIGQPEGADA